MARITVEDCLNKIDNRFMLVMVATKRARQLTLQGSESLVEPDNDKATVIALREIAAGLIGPSILEEKSSDDLPVFEKTRAVRVIQADGLADDLED